jgi:hypothetical protein
MLKVVPLRYGTVFRKAFSDHEDGEVEDADYPDPLMKRVIGSIRNKALSPDELARIIDEKAWEETRRDDRREGQREGELRATRDILMKLAQVSGLALGEGDVARIEACDDVETLKRWTLRVPGAKRATDALE